MKEEEEEEKKATMMHLPVQSRELFPNTVDVFFPSAVPTEYFIRSTSEACVSSPSLFYEIHLFTRSIRWKTK